MAVLRSREQIEENIESTLSSCIEDKEAIASYLHGQLQVMYWLAGLDHVQAFYKSTEDIKKRRYVNCSGCPFVSLVKPFADMGRIPVCGNCSSFQNPQGDVICEVEKCQS